MKGQARRRFQLFTSLLAALVMASCLWFKNPVELTAPTSTSPPPQGKQIGSLTPAPYGVQDLLASAGDPYAPQLGNSGYDVQQYSIDISLNPASPVITAETTIEALVNLDNLPELWLDFIGFEIDSLAVNGKESRYERVGDKLVIRFDKPLPADETVNVVVSYHGSPLAEPSIYVPFPTIGLQPRPPDNIYVVSEPDGSRYWFPCNDHPRDKALFSFDVTVPDGMTGVANGTLVEVQQDVPAPSLPGGLGDRYTWRHDYPMATYLATVSAGDYVRLEGSSPGGVPLRHYVFPDVRAEFKPFETSTGEMMDWLSDLLTPYPFEAYGYMTVIEMGGALETQTMVALSTDVIDERYIMHELVHMWFGDWVSLDSWGEIWRNEGFATYFTYLWFFRDDPLGLDAQMEDLSLGLRDDSHPLNNPPPEEMFGWDSYNKGALLVYDLHQTLGDEAFYKGLRDYFTQYGGGSASDAQFIAVMEQTSGRELDDFFERWFK